MSDDGKTGSPQFVPRATRRPSVRRRMFMLRSVVGNVFDPWPPGEPLRVEAVYLPSLPRNWPPLMNMPFSHGVHHSSRTRYLYSRVSLAILTVTSPG